MASSLLSQWIRWENEEIAILMTIISSIYTSKRMMSVPWLYINKKELALAHIKPIKFKHVENLPNQAHDAYFKP